LFANICFHHFRLPKALALRWWAAMAETAHPQVMRVHRKLSGYHGRVEAFVTWGWRQLPPKRPKPSEGRFFGQVQSF
jgi:hypothetical protein